MIYALNKIICKVLLLSITAMVVGCRSDLSEFGGTPATPSEGVPTLGVTLSVGSTRAATIPDKFEEGTGYENYLDIKNGDFRIYFFGNDNKYIATFIPSEKTFPASPAVSDFTYKFKGAIPSAVNVNNPFKLVVLANWGDGNYPLEPNVAAVPEGRLKLVAGVTTIADLTTHTSAQYLKLASPAESGEWLSDSRLIPFYGVREYNLSGKPELADKLDSDGRLKEDVYVELTEELPLLRAMAKVEVILDNPHASFSNVELTRVNAKGFCAPYKTGSDWKFDYTDYFEGDRYDWDKNFVRGVHLTNGATATNKGAGTNDADPGSIAFRKVNERTVEGSAVTPEKWVAYVPEYKNIGVTDFTTIRVTLADPRDPGSSPDWTNPTKDIYFAANGCDKAANDVAENRFDIERNNIYRFTVTKMTANLECKVDIQPYANVAVDPFFGLDRDEDGYIIVNRNPDGTYEILDDGNYIKKDPDGDVIKKRFKDGSLLCEVTIYKDYIHDDSEIDYVYVFEKDAPGGNMIILRQKTTGGTYHGDNIPTGEEHEHDIDDKALFILDKKGDFYYVHYDENHEVKELTRTDMKGDTIIQANGYQFRKMNEMTKYLGTYLVLCKDGSEELRHWQTGEPVDWDTGIGITRSRKNSSKFQWMKDLNKKIK